jgi:hypothetical protein
MKHWRGFFTDGPACGAEGIRPEDLAESHLDVKCLRCLRMGIKIEEEMHHCAAVSPEESPFPGIRCDNEAGHDGPHVGSVTFEWTLPPPSQ